ncbi:hypothetical protein EVAR_29735_1 [Eumeta japonica]|uniref:Uncharacterized protein n=1 Tax=Eumeta variegata TaxID=151549 RepID=A0A4C1VY85_EUMVA|nr:hypothetical protein EVAR_29735_1 [Eumeta japonica]
MEALHLCISVNPKAPFVRQRSSGHRGGSIGLFPQSSTNWRSDASNTTAVSHIVRVLKFQMRTWLHGIQSNRSTRSSAVAMLRLWVVECVYKIEIECSHGAHGVSKLRQFFSFDLTRKDGKERAPKHVSEELPLAMTGQKI